MSALSCPGCRAAMRRIDPSCAKCESCEGLWLSPAALSRRGARLSAELHAAVSKRPRSCPSCSVALTTYRSPRVEVDACDSCTGVFLDHGELEVLTRPPASTQRPPPPKKGPTADQLRGHIPVAKVGSGSSGSRGIDGADVAVSALSLIIDVIFD